MDNMAVASSSTGRSESGFSEIVEQLPSSSTTLKKGPCDVFINHHGKDVKLTLASSIYHYLDSHKVKSFLDQKELELGDCFPNEIKDVMRSAQIHIAIFSENYARSPWCLEELSLMLELSVTIIPVFYDVQPSDIRRVDSGMYAEAFREHEVKGRYAPATIKKWKSALNKVSLISGDIFNSNGDLGLHVQKIAERARQEIKNMTLPLEVARYPVGLDDAVKGFEDAIGRSAEGHQSVQIVGIVGASGVGKTTLAKELYNRKYKAFVGCSFLSEVRTAELTELQKELLKDLVHLENVTSKNVSKLKPILAGRFKILSGPVLIVLDDVDHFDQLDSLLPEEGRGLGSGSLIIVTTCSKDILRWRGISSIYEMETLDQHHAEELFCQHAFSQPSPPDDFKHLVQKFINACDGLPLSLKVIGQMLYKQSEDYWKSKLEKMPRVLPGEIATRLRLSYEALDPEERDIFLDVACFFVGEKKNLAIAVWDATSWSGFETLVSKCLVEVDKQNRIRMHNHLRDLGRQIATECLPRRLWSPEQIAEIKRKMKERMLSIRGIMAATAHFVACSAHNELPKCSHRYRPPFEEWMDLRSLELLVVTGEYFSSSVFAKLSMDLVWLRLFDFQDKDLPSWLSFSNLRVLELYGASKLQVLWESSARLPKELREMIITATEGNVFQRFPSIPSGLEHLKKIALISEHGEGFCFASLPDELCYLQSLEHLELRHCKLLQSLPERFGMLTKLRHLDLHSCEMLSKLPVSFKQLKDLEYLDLSDCRKIIPMPDIFENMENLKNLYFSGCSPRWRHLPLHITYQKSLMELHIQNTRLNDIPDNINKLSKLETLKIGSPCLAGLPKSLGDLACLTNLEITGCDKLEVLPPVEGLKLLERFCLEDSQVKSLPKGFGQLTNLQSLKIFDCRIGELDFSSVSSASSLGKLKIMHLQDNRVTRISIGKGSCPSLETFQLEDSACLTDIEICSTSIKIVKVYGCGMLQTLKIFDCPIGELDFSSASSRTLEKLKVMHLKGTKVTRVSICKDFCPSLETLQLEKNGDLTELEILSTSVKIVKVYQCTILRIIKGIPDLVNLETLEITECQELDQDTVAAAKNWEYNSIPSLTQRFNPLRIH